MQVILVKGEAKMHELASNLCILASALNIRFNKSQINCDWSHNFSFNIQDLVLCIKHTITGASVVVPSVVALLGGVFPLGGVNPLGGVHPLDFGGGVHPLDFGGGVQPSGGLNWQVMFAIAKENKIADNWKVFIIAVLHQLTRS